VAASYNSISFVSMLRNNMMEPTFNPCKSMVFSYFTNAFYGTSSISSHKCSSRETLNENYKYKNFKAIFVHHAPRSIIICLLENEFWQIYFISKLYAYAMHIDTGLYYITRVIKSRMMSGIHSTHKKCMET
jgi:hypothetical protein